MTSRIKRVGVTDAMNLLELARIHMIIAETFTLNPSLVHNRYRTVSMQFVSGNIPPLTGARERLPYLDKDLYGRVKFTVYLPISSSPLANSCRQISTRASSSLALAWPDPVPHMRL